tara:strand:- start:12071 stop:13159 length:1089 start_codon:yes stop_codon:yes gene_type:complete
VKFKTTQEEISHAVAFVFSAIEPRGTMPILNNVLVSCEDGKLTLTGTNLEIEKSIVIEVESQVNGSITIQGKKFSDICKSLDKHSDVAIEVKSDKATIKSGRSKWTLQTLPALDFPSFSGHKNEIYASVSGDELIKSIDKCSSAMANNDVRYYLNGLMIEVDNNKLTSVSTDGHRMIVVESECKSNSDSVFQSIIPRKSVDNLKSVIGNAEEVTINFSSNSVSISVEGKTMLSKLVDGKFPDYRRVIPKSTNKTVIANTSELKAAIRRASILANEKYKGIVMFISQGSAIIKASNPESEEAAEEVPISLSGDDIEIGFNGDYLANAINHLEDPNVTIKLGDSNGSALIEEGNYVAVVMPMRI